MLRTPPPNTHEAEEAYQPVKTKGQAMQATALYIENTPKTSSSNTIKKGTFDSKRAVFDRTSAEPRTTTQRSPPAASKPKVGPPSALNQTVTVRKSAGDGQKKRTRYADAKERLQEAKELLGTSRNLKTEVKNGVIEILEKLVQYVRESERENADQKLPPGECVAPPTRVEIPQYDRLRSMIMAHSEMLSANREQNEKLEEVLKNHVTLLETVEQHKTQLQQSLVHIKNLEGVVRYHAVTLEKTRENTATTTPAVKANAELLQEVRELKSTTQELSKRVELTSSGPRTYAEMAAQPRPRTGGKTHAIMVSTVNNDSSHILLDEVKDTLKAKENGIKIQKMKRVTGPKFVLSCDTKQELDHVAEKLTTNTKLVVEQAKFKNPLVVLKNVYKRITEADIITALARQNAEMAEGLSAEEATVAERYRRRARHPDECHVVLQVSPKLWQRMTAAGKLFVDVQCVRVQDQTPLIQCMRCLGYGHGRKTCTTEEEDRCTKCGQMGHTKKTCDHHTSCHNCVKAKLPHAHHDVFAAECPIRARADALARDAVAYE